MQKIVLLIDDDEEDHDIFIYHLKQYNPEIKVVSAFRGSHGIDLIPIVFPDWIFLDINMPGLHGLDVLKIIKKSKKYAHIPVFIYSTSDGFRSRPIAFALGASNYFKKPASIDAFEKIFSEALK